MTNLESLRKTIPQTGVVDWIGLRTERRGEVISVEKARAEVGVGLEGDHRSKRKPDPKNGRQVTLIQAEHLPVIAGILGKDTIDPALFRRNVIVRGINLQSLKGLHFKIGNVTLEGTGLCHPCSRMEENLGPGGYNATRGHGGLNARVIVAGQIAVGDEVRFESGLSD